jgi:glutaminyl-peptide cyclotransferase
MPVIASLPALGWSRTMSRLPPWLLVTALAPLVLSLTLTADPRPRSATVDSYRVVHAFTHDDHAYTQGLIFHNGYLYESTGLYGRSSLRKVKLETGEVMKQRSVAPAYFAEGLTEWRGELLQLTWRSEIAFAYDLATFNLRGTSAYPGEGWGLTHDGTSLILSDGSATLRFLDPSTFREPRRLVATDGGMPVKELNELEYVQGEVFANVWHSNRIARIAPTTGRVSGWIDLTGLLSGPFRLDPEAVLNGIAYDEAGKRLFVTGKLWPKLFEIEVVRGK